MIFYYVWPDQWASLTVFTAASYILCSDQRTSAVVFTAESSKVWKIDALSTGCSISDLLVQWWYNNLDWLTFLYWWRHAVRFRSRCCWTSRNQFLRRIIEHWWRSWSFGSVDGAGRNCFNLYWALYRFLNHVWLTSSDFTYPSASVIDLLSIDILIIAYNLPGAVLGITTVKSHYRAQNEVALVYQGFFGTTIMVLDAGSITLL